jgi:hypothetical protein
MAALKTVILTLASIGVAIGANSRLQAMEGVPSDRDVANGWAELPGLTFDVILPKQRYEQGEPILVSLRYRYYGTRRLGVHAPTYDRSGRMMDFGFRGWDPRGNKPRDSFLHQGGSGGGMSQDPILGSSGIQQVTTVNDWLAFDHPGKYTLQAYSSAVRVLDGAPGFEVHLESEPLAVEIVPPVDAHRVARLAADRKALTVQYSGEEWQEKRMAALEDLRVMQDPRAIPLLVPCLESDIPNEEFTAYQALSAMLDLIPVRMALMERLHRAVTLRPEHAWAFIDLLAEAEIRDAGPDKRYSREYDAAEKRYDEELKAK